MDEKRVEAAHSDLSGKKASKRRNQVHQELGNRRLPTETHDAAENSLFETMSRVERDLNDLISGLSLLGLKRCSQCRQFFRCAGKS